MTATEQLRTVLAAAIAPVVITALAVPTILFVRGSMTIPPDTLRGLAVTAGQRDGQVVVAFRRSAQDGDDLFIRCSYRRADRAASSACGTHRAAAGPTVRYIATLPFGVPVKLALQACNSPTAVSADACAEPVVTAARAPGPPPRPTHLSCEVGYGQITFGWAQHATRWAISVDHNAYEGLSGPGKTISVANTGAVHTARVVAIDKRNERSSPATLRCAAQRTVSHGSVDDPAGNSTDPNRPSLTLGTVSWDLTAKVLRVRVGIKATIPRRYFLGVFVDADHRVGTGDRGIGCPSPGIHHDLIGVDAYDEFDEGYVNAGLRHYCIDAAAYNGAQAQQRGHTVLFTLPLTFGHAPDYLTMMIAGGTYANSRDATGNFLDFVPHDHVIKVRLR